MDVRDDAWVWIGPDDEPTLKRTLVYRTMLQEPIRVGVA
jgi:hypothetical protein